LWQKSFFRDFVFPFPKEKYDFPFGHVLIHISTMLSSFKPEMSESQYVETRDKLYDQLRNLNHDNVIGYAVLEVYNHNSSLTMPVPSNEYTILGPSDGVIGLTKDALDVEQVDCHVIVPYKELIRLAVVKMHTTKLLSVISLR
jgi:hypothetical protein